MKTTANTVWAIVIITMVTSIPLHISGNTVVVKTITTEVYTTDEMSLLDSIEAHAKNAYEGAVEMKDSAKEKLTSLMNDQNLSAKIKSSISDDIRIIQEGFDKHVASNVQNAYQHLQSALDDRRAELSGTPRGKAQRALDFITEKFAAAKQGLSNMYHSIRS